MAMSSASWTIRWDSGAFSGHGGPEKLIDQALGILDWYFPASLNLLRQDLRDLFIWWRPTEAALLVGCVFKEHLQKIHSLWPCSSLTLGVYYHKIYN